MKDKENASLGDADLEAGPEVRPHGQPIDYREPVPEAMHTKSISVPEPMHTKLVPMAGHSSIQVNQLELSDSTVYDSLSHSEQKGYTALQNCHETGYNADNVYEPMNESSCDGHPTYETVDNASYECSYDEVLDGGTPFRYEVPDRTEQAKRASDACQQ